MKRRRFLQSAMALPLLPAPFAFAQRQVREAPVLLLIELTGGNDSLNTVVPLDQLDVYQALRPRLALSEEQRLSLDSHFALHQALKPLLPLWRGGEMTLVHGLGYPQPNRSHFRAIEIWDTASSSNEYLDQGWLAGPARSITRADIDAIVIGRNTAPVSGGGSRVFGIDSLEGFLMQSGKIIGIGSETDNAALRRVVDAQYSIEAGNRLLNAVQTRAKNAHAGYPQGSFGRQLADASRIIRADLGVPVLKLALGSFDTHRNQRTQHARLLTQFAQGIAALRSELVASGHWRSVLVMTYSEFGRRAAENGSGGTDHGTAATHFVFGGKIRGGHLGRHPDLTTLQDLDMQYSTDFRQLYQTVLNDWWQRPDLRIPGGDWSTLGLIS